GGVKPPPVGRLRRARQPPSLVQHRSLRVRHRSLDSLPPFVLARTYLILKTKPSVDMPKLRCVTSLYDYTNHLGLGEPAAGVSPAAARRTVREPLDSHGSHHPVVTVMAWRSSSGRIALGRALRPCPGRLVPASSACDTACTSARSTGPDSH